MPATGNRSNAFYLRPTRWQLLAVVACLPPLWLSAGRDGTEAFVFGAFCAVLPQAYFALRMARASRQGAAQAARAGLAAEAGKFLLSVASFALVFAVLKPERPLLVFLGFGLLWLVQVAATAMLLRR